MNVHFDWQAGSEDGQWETIAEIGNRTRRKWPWWAWVTVLATVVVLGAAGYLVLRSRYAQALQQAEFQIQSVIDAEAQAFDQRDIARFLAHQDKASPDWYDLQEQRIRSGCLRGPTERGIMAFYDVCAPVLPARVQRVDVQGDVAWVEVIEGEDLVRRARFYRRTDQGWKHTAPQIEFWNVAIELRYGDVLFRYHRRDQPYVDPLVERAAEVFYDVCGKLECTEVSRTLLVNFAVLLPAPLSTDGLPRVEGAELVLPSPWLSGLPVEGEWDEVYMGELTWWVANATASQAMRSSPSQDLSPLQKTIAAEYAAWYSDQNVARAPILRQIIAQHGTEALPRVFRWLRDTRDTHNLGQLMNRWLSIGPGEDQAVLLAATPHSGTEAVWAHHQDLAAPAAAAPLVQPAELCLDEAHSGGVWAQH